MAKVNHNNNECAGELPGWEPEFGMQVMVHTCRCGRRFVGQPARLEGERNVVVVRWRQEA